MKNWSQGLRNVLIPDLEPKNNVFLTAAEMTQRKQHAKGSTFISLLR